MPDVSVTGEDWERVQTDLVSVADARVSVDVNAARERARTLLREQYVEVSTFNALARDVLALADEVDALRASR